jgi:uncharacterized membrane protein
LVAVVAELILLMLAEMVAGLVLDLTYQLEADMVLTDKTNTRAELAVLGPVAS